MLLLSVTRLTFSRTESTGLRLG